MWFDGGHHSLMFGPSGFGMIAFWIFIIAAFALLWKVVRGRGSDESSDVHHQTGREILDERYARGEINREEYEQKKRDLAG